MILEARSTLFTEDLCTALIKKKAKEALFLWILMCVCYFQNHHRVTCEAYFFPVYGLQQNLQPQERAGCNSVIVCGITGEEADGTL